MHFDPSVPDPHPIADRAAASAARHATDDPNTFLIPAAELPPGFAETVEDPNLIPAPARPAATVALIRDSEAGVQVLLLRRPRRSGFAAGAWVFPGGVVDAADRAAELETCLDGPTAAEWAARLGLGDPGVAQGYVAAAMREAWEETGILLARPAAGTSRLDDPEALEVSRTALLGGVISLRQAAVGDGFRLAGDRLVYFAHWITPEPEPRRFDTRFFVAAVPRGTECRRHEKEMVDALWCTASESVGRFDRGEMKMLPPTVHSLRRLAAFATAAEAVEALRDASVPPVLPRMRRHPNGVAIEVPE